MGANLLNFSRTYVFGWDRQPSYGLEETFGSFTEKTSPLKGCQRNYKSGNKLTFFRHSLSFPEERAVTMLNFSTLFQG